MSDAQRFAAARADARRVAWETFGVEVMVVPGDGGSAVSLRVIETRDDSDIQGGLQARAWAPTVTVEVVAAAWLAEVGRAPMDSDQMWFGEIGHRVKAPRRTDPRAEIWKLELEPLE